MSNSVRTLSLLTVALSTFLATACGSGDGKPVSMDEMPDRMAEVYCGQMFECCSSSERQAQTSTSLAVDVDSEQTCRDTYGGLLQAFLLAPLRTSVDEGRAAYDPEAMGECLADQKADGCGNVPTDETLPTTCEEGIIPKVELGGTCTRDYECKKGQCYKGDADGETGTCQKLPADGEDCADFQCREGFYCRGDSCQPKKAEGEVCVSHGMCQSDVCDGGSCAPKKSGGESCETDSQCQSGLCNRNGGGDSGTCLGAPACDGE